MTPSDQNQDELDAILADLFETGLTAQQSSRLEMLIKANPQQLRRYIRYVTLHSHLQWRAGAIGRADEQLSQSSLDDAVVMPAITDDDPESSREVSSESYVPSPSPAPVQSKRSVKLRIGGLAASIVLLASVAVWVWLGHQQAKPVALNSRTTVIQAPTVTPQESRPREAEVSATLTASAGGVWEDSTPCVKGDLLAVARPHSLSQGWIQMTMAGGAQVLLEAPAQFTLDSPGKISLTRGRLAAYVPVQARGFTVRMPRLELVDLGTEFTAICDDRQTKVSVFRGKVVATTQGGSARPSPVTLEALQAGEFSGDRFVRLPQAAELDSGVRCIGGQNMPPGWQAADVGAPPLPGSTTIEQPGTWKLTGCGSDIFHKSDQFHFASASVRGDCTIQARILSASPVEAQIILPYSKRGVMLRDSTDPGSLHVGVFYTERLGMQMIARRTNGQDADVIGRYAVPGQLPCWVRLTRSGDIFVGAYSNDGTNWQQLGSCQVAFTSHTNLAGVAVCSHDSAKLRGGSFSDVSVINR